MPLPRRPSAEHFREIARFGVVGAFNAGTYFGLYTAGVLTGVPYVLAALIAFAMSATLGYWLHEHWTFGGAAPSAHALGKWLATQGVAAGLNVALLAIAVDHLGAGEIVAQLILMPVMPAATYLVGRRFVFTRASRGSGAAA